MLIAGSSTVFSPLRPAQPRGLLSLQSHEYPKLRYSQIPTGPPCIQPLLSLSNLHSCKTLYVVQKCLQPNDLTESANVKAAVTKKA